MSKLKRGKVKLKKLFSRRLLEQIISKLHINNAVKHKIDSIRFDLNSRTEAICDNPVRKNEYLENTV